MTMIVIARCTNCGDMYQNQLSGAQQVPESTDKYCPVCWAEVRKALASVPKKLVPRKVELRYTTRFRGITMEMLEQWEKDYAEGHKAKEATDGLRFPLIRRVEVGLLDLEHDDYQSPRYIHGRGKFEGYNFLLSTWQKSPGWMAAIELEYNVPEQRFTGRCWNYRLEGTRLDPDPPPPIDGTHYIEVPGAPTYEWMVKPPDPSRLSEIFYTQFKHGENKDKPKKNTKIFEE